MENDTDNNDEDNDNNADVKMIRWVAKDDQHDVDDDNYNVLATAIYAVCAFMQACRKVSK